jgi:hypothetical protein
MSMHIGSFNDVRRSSEHRGRSIQNDNVAFARFGSQVGMQDPYQKLCQVLGVVDPPPDASDSEIRHHRFICALLDGNLKEARSHQDAEMRVHAQE